MPGLGPPHCLERVNFNNIHIGDIVRYKTREKNENYFLSLSVKSSIALSSIPFP